MLGPPLLALVVEALLSGAVPRVRPFVHAAICGVFVGVLGAEVVKHETSARPAVIVTAGIVAGVLGAIAVLRFAGVRTYLAVLAPVAVIVPLVFLFTSPAADALGGATSATLADVHSTRPHRVVLVVFDELPVMSLLDGTGHVDAGLYPNFAALEHTSTWYRNETTVAGFTSAAVPAILTGRYPVGTITTLPVLDRYPQNVFTLLGHAGTVNGHEATTGLCPDQLCVGRSGGIRDLVDATGALWREYASPHRSVATTVDFDSARKSVDVGRAFVRSLRPTTGMHLDVAHLELPHNPWERLPSLQRYDVPANPPDESYAVNPAGPGLATARIRHLLQTQAADTMLGLVLHRLRAIRVLDDAMVVVTADHGVSLTAGETLRNPTPTNLAEVMYPPLFVKYPGEHRGVIDQRRAESIDIVPTIADVVGVRIPWKVDGVSLLGPAPARPTRRLYPWIWFPAPNDLRPPVGREYVDVAGTKEYARVVAARAAPPGGDPRLRVFRIGPYGGLVGQLVAPRLAAGPRCVGTVGDASRFRRIRMQGSVLPWVWSEGAFRGAVRRSVWVAVIAGDRVGAVAQTVVDGDHHRFGFLLPPALVHAGALRVRIAAISGAPATARLHECANRP
jgi:hypothetical protein